MKKDIHFVHAVCGPNRPQIILIGNGLELGCKPTQKPKKGPSDQLSWDDVVIKINVNKSINPKKTDINSIPLPFPLLYSLLSVPFPAPAKLDKAAVDKEEKKLKEAMNELAQYSTVHLDKLKTLGADHIMSTNYSYGLEQAFFPGIDFLNSSTRSAHRFNLNPEKTDSGPKREICYRMHSGYYAANQDGSPVGLWHIHGECGASKGVVLGHDRYGRLLSRIEKICDNQDYKNLTKDPDNFEFVSWPELFLYGDVYIVGFGFKECEFDLWWLLKRKQRERYADGRVYFYEEPDPNSVKQKLLLAHGVELVDVGAAKGDFDDHYKKAFEDIKRRIASRNP